MQTAEPCRLPPTPDSREDQLELVRRHRAGRLSGTGDSRHLRSNHVAQPLRSCVHFTHKTGHACTSCKANP
jgi:hypothetical protein